MRRSMLALLLALGLVLAACASDPDAGGSTTSGGTTATTSGGTTATTGESDDDGAEEGGDAEAGAEVFAGTCATCHGPDAKGITGLGKDMTTSQFIADSTDAELIAFIKVGRATDDPANTTGVAMPAKGGNPSLDDEDLADVVAYMRTLQES